MTNWYFHYEDYKTERGAERAAINLHRRGYSAKVRMIARATVRAKLNPIWAVYSTLEPRSLRQPRAKVGKGGKKR